MPAGQYSLDDQRLVSRLDPSGMICAIDQAADYLRDPFLDEQKTRISRRDFRVEKIVFGGMGGSAIAADVMVDWLLERLDIPVLVVRDKLLPSFVDRKTLFVALSYSGETSETLNLYRHSRSRHCIRVGVGTGGRLGRMCSQYDDPFFSVRPSVAPRAALYQIVAACALVLEEYGLAQGLRSELRRTAAELEMLLPSLALQNPTRSNRAKRTAMSLQGGLPAIYALQRLSSVARRFKCQLNENSKVPAKYDLLPEAGHNEVEAWTQNDRRLIPVFIRDKRELRWEGRIMEGFERTILGKSDFSIEVNVPSHSRLGGLLAPTLFLDYVSVYLAYLNRVDPTPTLMIKQFRKNIR